MRLVNAVYLPSSSAESTIGPFLSKINKEITNGGTNFNYRKTDKGLFIYTEGNIHNILVP